jgi:hypothetical protein
MLPELFHNAHIPWALDMEPEHPLQLIHKVWEVDPHISRCGAEMKIIALIDDPAVIRRILTHLGLWRERKGNERGTAPLEEPARRTPISFTIRWTTWLGTPTHTGPASCDYAQASDWPGYDESPYQYH